MSTIPTPGTEIVRKPWQTGLAPVYIGMFLWIAFFDQLGRNALPTGGLGSSILGAALAGPLAYLLLFRASANWGYRTGQPLKVVASSTFGVRGAMIVPGLLIGIAQIVLFAVAVGYAIELTFQGLVLTRLVNPQAVRPGQLGGSSLKAPLYLATALIWAIATALVSLRFIRWIAFLMQFFPIFPALLLAVAMASTLTGIATFNARSASIGGEAKLQAFLLTLQWTFAFSSMAGVMGADWGAGSVKSADIRLGGWIGLAFAPAIISALALIAVAGYSGMKEASLEQDRFPPSSPIFSEPNAPNRVSSSGITPGLDAPSYTFREILNGRFDPRIGGPMLLIFGLASLAPAVYSSFMFGQQLKEIGPGISRLTWTMLGTCTAWLLIVGGWFDRTEIAFNLLGAAFAPIAGAISADYRRQRGQWPGPRLGSNPAGLLAWGIGLIVGLIPTIGRVFGSVKLEKFPLAAVWAFFAAYVAYELLALLRLESATDPDPLAIKPVE